MALWDLYGILALIKHCVYVSCVSWKTAIIYVCIMSVCSVVVQILFFFFLIVCNSKKFIPFAYLALNHVLHVVPTHPVMVSLGLFLATVFP